MRSAPLGLVLALVMSGTAIAAETLRGRVRDEQDRGVADVTISLSGPVTRTAEVGPDGRFRLTDLPAGRYSLAVTPPRGSQALHPSQIHVPVSDPPIFVLSAAVLPIPRVQGAGHISPFNRKTVTTAGVVTALRGNRGFYVQSPREDADNQTSEGVFVYTTQTPTVRPGELVIVRGRVQEYYTGGRDSGDLSVTQIKLTETTVLATDWALPRPVVLGRGGRIPPDRVLSDDSSGNVEDSPFDPEQDGLDFFESLEGMLVRVNEPLVVGTIHTAYGEFQVLGDLGREASTPTARGGVILTKGDFNPEKITVDLKGAPDVFPQSYRGLVVGDRFTGPIIGPLDYNHSDYKILPWRALPDVIPALLERQVATPVEGTNTLTCAAFNVENLSARSTPQKITDIAVTIVKALHSPDIVALSEVQDSTGTINDGVVSAADTIGLLVDAIGNAGGPPTYQWVDIAPEDGKDGGAPGANIRVGFLFDTDRVELVDRPGRGSGAPARMTGATGRPQLIPSPGRINPASRAFAGSRKPLVAEFRFNGNTIFFVASHFSSKGGDAQIFGRIHPLVFRSEARRQRQAMEVNAFVRTIVALDPQAAVVVLGDFNEFAWAPPMDTLKGDLLVDLAEELLAPQERYTYVYRGNSQDLDHILISRSLMRRASPSVQIVHRYAEYLYGRRHSDHDPVLASLTFP